MFTLSSGDFLVRDNTRLMLFSGRENSTTQQGNFIAVLCEETASSKCSGLAEDEEGRVATIKEGKGEAIELLFFDLKSKSVTRRLDIGHALTDRNNSKCRLTDSFTNINICSGSLQSREESSTSVTLVCTTSMSWTLPQAFCYW